MLQSRTVRTLTTLFSAMTIGALSLMWMETAPIDETPLTLTARSSSPVSDGAVVYHTHVPVRQSKWNHVILLSAPSSDHETARACHFIVSDGKVTATTELWKRQVDGYHTFAPGNDWNADSIGVCFVGDLTDAALNTGQFNELMSLVQRLQFDFKIRPERVYLHSELDDRTERPSGLFVRTFAQRLLQSQSR
ncbi:MAG: N-acetylmuramoyl-L-alanine amidase [bacterium]|nr:N-acetylmuramoyl-L-alanine amidase [bacterium]